MHFCNARALYKIENGCDGFIKSTKMAFPSTSEHNYYLMVLRYYVISSHSFKWKLSYQSYQTLFVQRCKLQDRKCKMECNQANVMLTKALIDFPKWKMDVVFDFSNTAFSTHFILLSNDFLMIFTRWIVRVKRKCFTLDSMVKVILRQLFEWWNPLA